MEDPRETVDLYSAKPKVHAEMMQLLEAARKTNFEPEIPKVTLKQVCDASAKNEGRFTPADWKPAGES